MNPTKTGGGELSCYISKTYICMSGKMKNGNNGKGENVIFSRVHIFFYISYC